ncbi:MAG: CoA transferase [Paracoccaceae bacterium]|nr:CoA transferase [Paracoccaceae bacterium]MDG2259593.1 CoA transferase [Paracoccaceae bacterium]
MPEKLPMDDLPLIPVGQGFRFLEGVRVVDLTTSIAGPYATMMLADLGAEVIKIERPEGDDARYWGPPFLNGESLWFASVNRGKKSIALDLTDDAGQDALRALVQSADVFVTNQPPRVQKKLGLDYETLSSIKPDIVFTSITGFGLSGERSDLTCYDLIAEGYSGIMDLTGTADEAPQKVGTPAADMLSGQDAAMATIAALFDRQKSGAGHLVDVALLDSMTRFLAPRINSYLGSGEVPRRSGGTDSVIAVYQAFDTADDPITLGLGTNAIWQRFWTAVGNPDFAGQEGFATNAERRVNRDEIVAVIQEQLLNKDRSHWLKIFREARVPAGPINRVDEVSADAALQERGLIFALQDGDRVVPQVGLGVQFDGKFAIPRSAPPHLGEHTKDILAALQAETAGVAGEEGKSS